MLIQLNSDIFNTPLFRRAASSAVTYFDAVGRWLVLCEYCQRYRTDSISVDDAAALVGEEFARAMVMAGLVGDHGTALAIPGQARRISYLERQRERQRQKIPLITDSGPAAADTAPRPQPQKKPTVRKARAQDAYTEEERASVRRILAKITERTGVQYRDSQAHTRLICARLRDGISERELRGIVAYCWDESGLGWGGKELPGGGSMERYLRPETLFGPLTVDKYIHPARAWLDKFFPEAA